MDNRDELNNFLRKKLNQLDTGKDGWDKPNPTIWSSTKEALAHKKQRTILLPNKKWAIAASFAFFSLISYACYLQIQYVKYQKLQAEYVQLEDRYNNQQEQLNNIQVNKEASTLTKDSTAFNPSQGIEPKETTKPLITEPPSIPPDKKLAESSPTEPIKNNQVIINQNNESIENTSTLELRNSNREQRNTEFIAELEITTLDKQQENHSQLFLPKQIHVKRKKGSRLPDVKFGLDHTFGDRSFPEFKDYPYSIYEEEGVYHSTVFEQQTFGASFSVALSDRIWINTGYRKGTLGGEVNNEWSLLLDEDDFNSATNGSELLEFEYANSGPLGNYSGIIIFETEGMQDFQEQQLAFAELTEVLSYKIIQIPVQLEYLYPIKNLKLGTMIGYQWNQVSLESYDVYSELYSLDQDFAIKETNFLLDSEDNVFKSQFSNIQLGLGVHYDLGKHLNLSARLILENSSNAIRSLEQKEQVNRMYSVGITYTL